jgi:hypothetical protein
MKLMSCPDAGRLAAWRPAPRMALDALAHAGEFVFPLARSAGVVSTVATTGRRGGRVGIVGADRDLQLRQHAGRLVGAAAHHAERADALAVEREALRERSGHEEVHARRDELATTAPSSAMPGAEALVGHVEEGHQAARLHQRHHLRPLRGVRSQPVGLWQQACSTTTVPAVPAAGQPACRQSDAARGGVVVGVGRRPRSRPA